MRLLLRESSTIQAAWFIQGNAQRKVVRFKHEQDVLICALRVQ